jgi:proteic killer suppression protein
MILTFRCSETERIFLGERSRRFPVEIQKTARRKLMQLHRARALDDLRFPPGNRLEALRGNRQGQWSIRVNEQWGVPSGPCFVWRDGNAYQVEMVDYH